VHFSRLSRRIFIVPLENGTPVSGLMGIAIFLRFFTGGMQDRLAQTDGRTQNKPSRCLSIKTGLVNQGV